MGAVCRYSISALAAKYLGTRFPWGTLFANLAGCFLIGGDAFCQSRRLFSDRCYFCHLRPNTFLKPSHAAVFHDRLSGSTHNVFHLCIGNSPGSPNRVRRQRFLKLCLKQYRGCILRYLRHVGYAVYIKCIRIKEKFSTAGIL